MSETVLQEAHRITGGDRADDYGSALADAQRVAQIASAITGYDIKPEHDEMTALSGKERP